MATDDKCPGCGEHIDVCYYGGDCLEVDAIYREQQREKLRDIELTDEEAEELARLGASIDDYDDLLFANRQYW